MRYMQIIAKIYGDEVIQFRFLDNIFVVLAQYCNFFCNDKRKPNYQIYVIPQHQYVLLKCQRFCWLLSL